MFFRFPRLRRIGQTLAGTARVALTLTVLVVGASLLWLRSAEARASEVLFDFGRELMSWQGTQPHSSPRHLTVNGLQLRVMTLSSKDGVQDLLDRFADHCRTHGGVSEPALSKEGVEFETSIRRDNEREGVLACIDSERPLGLDELTERLQKVSRSGDLGELGELRYTYVRRSGNTSTALVLWTEGSANLFSMFPQTGDAPGKDPVDVPRPERLRRLLSATEQGAPYAVNVYAAEGRSEAGLRAWYARRLAHRGWSVTTEGSTLTARHGSRTLLIHLATGTDGRRVVSIAELS
jgi:hypothetical protein